jgi:hypothetical protein
VASEYSRDQFGALGIPLREVSHDRIWEAESTYSEAGPIPGLVTPSATGQGLALRAHGAASSGQALDLRIARGGLPGPRGVAAIWRNQASPVEDWRGQDIPTVLTDLRTLTDGANTRARDLISLPDGQAIAVYEEQSGGAWSTKVRNMTAGGAWSSAVTLAGTSSTERYPALVRLPDGRILLYQWKPDSGTITDPVLQIECWDSTDNGAAWRLSAPGVLLEPIPTSTTAASKYVGLRIRAAYNAGEILIIAGLQEGSSSTATYRHALAQFASFDYGHTFSRILLQDGSSLQHGKDPCAVAAPGGGFVVTAIGQITGVVLTYVVRLGSAGAALPSLTSDLIPDGSASTLIGSASLASKLFSDSDNGLAITEDGTLYMFTRSTWSSLAVTANQCNVGRSRDLGRNWQALGKSPNFSNSSAAIDGSTWWFGDDASTSPIRFTMCANQGRILGICNHQASAGTRGNDLSILHLGGHSQITAAAYSADPAELRRVHFPYTWLPFDLPDATGGAIAAGSPLPWTLTSAGSPSVQLRHSATYNALQLQITTAIGESNYYGVTPPGSPVEGLTVFAELFYNSGPSTPTLENGIAIVLADGSDDLDLEVRLGSDGLLVYDNNAAAQVGSEATGIATAAGIQILISVAVSAAGGLGRVSLWYRAYQVNTGSDRTWTRHLNGAALTNNTGSPSPTSSLEWGAVATAIAARTCRWSALHFAGDEYNGAGLHSATLPDDLHPIPLGPDPVWIDSGVSISAVAGPAFEGQAYTVEAEHRYGLDRLDWRRYPSPRQPWRSTGTVAARIAWRLDQGLGETAFLFERGGIALYLEGINFQTGLLQAHNGSTWSTIATLNAAAGATGLPWTRAGARVHPGASAAGARYYQRNELAGGTFNLDGDRRRIVANTAGLWVGSSTSTVKRCIIELEGVTGAEAASGSSGQIWAPRLLAYVYSTAGAGAAYQGIRVQIDGGASNVRDAYQEIGAAIVAGIVPLPWSPGGEGSPLGFTLERQIEVTTLRDGSRSVRRLGPDRRVFEIAWPSAPTAGVWRASPDPEYVATTSTAGAEPAASRHELPYLIEGILREGEGGPLLWIPRLDRGPPDSGVLTSRERVALVRVAGDLERRVVYGSPISSEVVEVEGVRLEEVL